MPERVAERREIAFWPALNKSREGVAVATSRAYVPDRDDYLRPNRLLSCREAQGASSEVVEVGDLSRRKSERGGAVRNVFPDDDGGRQGRKRSAQAAIGQAPFRTPVTAPAVTASPIAGELVSAPFPLAQQHSPSGPTVERLPMGHLVQGRHPFSPRRDCDRRYSDARQASPPWARSRQLVSPAPGETFRARSSNKSRNVGGKLKPAMV
jgi:hypothetical protein